MGFQHSLITGLVYPGKNDGLLIQRYHPPYWSKTWQIPGKDGKPVVIRAVWDGTVMNVSVDVASGELTAGPPRAIFKAYLYEIKDLDFVATSQELKFSFALEYANGSWRVNDQYEGGSVTLQDRYFVGQGTPFSYKIFDTVHGRSRLASFEQTSAVRRNGELLIGTGPAPNYGVALPSPGTVRYVTRTNNGTWATWDGTYADGVATVEQVGTMTEPLRNPATFQTVLPGFYMNQSGSEAMHICPAHVDTNLPALLRVGMPDMTPTVQQASQDIYTTTGGVVDVSGLDSGPSGATLFMFGSKGLDPGASLSSVPTADRVSVSGSWSEEKGEFFVTRHEEWTAEYYVRAAFSSSIRTLVQISYVMDGNRYYTGSGVAVDSTSTLTATIFGQTYTRTEHTTGETYYVTNEFGHSVLFDDFEHELTVTQPFMVGAVFDPNGNGVVTSADWTITSTITGTAPGPYTTSFSTPGWVTMQGSTVFAGLVGGVRDHISYGEVIAAGSHSHSGSWNDWAASAVPFVPRGRLVTTGSPTEHTFAYCAALGSDGEGGGNVGWPYTVTWTYSYDKTAGSTDDRIKFPLAGDYDPSNNTVITTVDDGVLTTSEPVSIRKTKTAYQVPSGSVRIDEEFSSSTGAVVTADSTTIFHNGAQVGACSYVTTHGASSTAQTLTREVRRDDGVWDESILTSSDASQQGTVTTTGDKMEIMFADPRIRFYIYARQTPSFPGDSNFLYTNLHVTLQGQEFGPFDLGANYLEGPRALITDRLTLKTAATALVDGVWWALVIVNLYNGKSFGRLFSSDGEQIDLADLLTGAPEHYWIRNIEHVQ